MPEKQRETDDTALHHVRAARHEISAEHGHNPQRVVDYYVERQQARGIDTEEAATSEEE